MTATAAPHMVESGIMPGGSETILVVDDEESIRKLIARLLGSRGYTVVAASSGEEAIRVCDEQAGTIDLLLVDLELPDISGRELASRLRARRAEMKLLYMSGYGERAFDDFRIVPAGRIFLPKPFTHYELAWRVREVLDGGSAS